jgi:hypothetical protein
MRAVYDFIIKPYNERTNSKKQINGSELILNTDLQNHQYVSRHAVVLEKPVAIQTEVEKHDEVIVHHNVFRRFRDIRGVEKNSRSYIDENTFLASIDQIYAYKRNDEWKSTKGFCFIKPLIEQDVWKDGVEVKGQGIVKYSDGFLKKGQLVYFKPGVEYEFFIENQRLYRVPNSLILIKYEYQGDEKEYNPSWTQSS